MRSVPLLVAALLLLPAAESRAQQFLYIWNGPVFATTSGTVPVGAAVSGSLVLQGPVENLPFGEVSPVSFSFSAGPVTIDDTTPLHALTRIRLQTDATGKVIATEIQLVEEIDTSGGVTYADVICVASCPAAGSQDAVIDRNELAVVIGSGEVPVAGSFWFDPVPLGPPGVPALPAIGRLALAAALAAGAAGPLPGIRRWRRR